MKPWIGSMRAILAAMLCFGLSGCFDFEQSLTLDGDGTGMFAVMLRMDPAFQDAREDEQILPEQANPVEITRGVRDGQYVQEEAVRFNDLSELRVQNEELSITNNGSTVFGLGPKNLTLRRVLANDGAEPDSYSMMRGLFRGRYYVFRAKLPGWVDHAYPVKVGDETIEPVIDGGLVTWQIPISRAISEPTLEFQIDFRAYLSIDAVVSANEVDGNFLQLAPGLSVP